jgi:hypothetical protein
MHVDTTAVDHLLGTGELPDHWLLGVAAGDDAAPVAPVLPARAEHAAIAGLRDALIDLTAPFVPVHPEAWTALFGDWTAAVADARLALVAGWPAPYDAGVRTAPDGSRVIVLDLARIATYGDAAEALDAARQMLDHEVAHVVVGERWPLTADPCFADRLDRITFDEGIAHYLAMRDHSAVDPTSPARADRWTAAVTELRSARALTDRPAQRDALLRADAADGFWDKYACVAGLLAFVDAEHEGGWEAAGALAAQGWRGFAERVAG